MHGVVEDLIKVRREHGEDTTKKDLLNFMLAGVDRQTGQRLDDTQIRDETIIFLIAGHETTSGLLSFAIYALLNHPEVLAKAYAEVDRVLGPDLSVRPTYAQVNQLTYIAQILKETLRLWPTAPAFGIHALEDTLLGGKLSAEEAAITAWCWRRCCIATRRCGATGPRCSTPTISPARRRRRGPPTPTSRSATASAPASAGSSPCRRRRWCSA